MSNWKQVGFRKVENNKDKNQNPKGTKFNPNKISLSAQENSLNLAKKWSSKKILLNNIPIEEDSKTTMKQMNNTFGVESQTERKNSLKQCLIQKSSKEKYLKIVNEIEKQFGQFRKDLDKKLETEDDKIKQIKRIIEKIPQDKFEKSITQQQINKLDSNLQVSQLFSLMESSMAIKFNGSTKLKKGASTEILRANFQNPEKQIQVPKIVIKTEQGVLYNQQNRKTKPENIFS